jgi:hypothetical protein
MQQQDAKKQFQPGKDDGRRVEEAAGKNLVL